MGRRRLFDHDDAVRRIAAGEPIADIARNVGVTPNAIYHLTAKGRETQQRSVSNYYERRRVPCQGKCGKLVLTLDIKGKADNNADGRLLCCQCRGRERRERFHFDRRGKLIAVRCVMVDCANGERWQPPERFTKGSRYHDLRAGGIHTSCRACQTRARRIYRAAHPEKRASENKKRMELYYAQRGSA